MKKSTKTLLMYCLLAFLSGYLFAKYYPMKKTIKEGFQLHLPPCTNADGVDVQPAPISMSSDGIRDGDDLNKYLKMGKGLGQGTDTDPQRCYFNSDGTPLDSIGDTDEERAEFNNINPSTNALLKIKKKCARDLELVGEGSFRNKLYTAIEGAIANTNNVPFSDCILNDITL